MLCGLSSNVLPQLLWPAELFPCRRSVLQLGWPCYRRVRDGGNHDPRQTTGASTEFVGRRGLISGAPRPTGFIALVPIPERW